MYGPPDYVDVVDPLLFVAVDVFLAAEHCDFVASLGEPLGCGLDDVFYAADVRGVAGGYVEELHLLVLLA
ncbi:MAG: hypothetical protein QW628_10970, partial [Thermofilum sp.]